MDFLDAAYHILQSAGEPLHYSEITRRALDLGILKTNGQTPEATMGSRLYVDTKSPDSRFQRVGRGTFALAAPVQHPVVRQIDELNQTVRDQLHQRLQTMPPDRFEALIGELLIALGFAEDTINVTRYQKDGGIDVRGVLKAGAIAEVKVAVQVKRWKHNVQAPTVQALRGALAVGEQGVIITTSDFTADAKREAQAPARTRISLVNGEQLIDLLIQHQLGVKTETYTTLSLDEEWWDAIANLNSQPLSPLPNSQPSSPSPQSLPFRQPRGSVASKLIEAAERAIREGRIDTQTKIATGHTRYLVNHEPRHKNGRDFFAPVRLSNGLYLETHTSNKQADDQVRLLNTWSANRNRW
ncbi:restriction endonuclease [uncultured Chloroflexus sp.]|uniref:restriction endonuclease n=1 Tax=uncultured Chloroflexus sp. TaxID=214040 RepID=UPI0026176331|nr:restriction endonuclease [uncultured Chloroflexus sp.]